LASDEFPKVVTRRAPTPENGIALRFAWRVCGHVKSNAVIFTSADRTWQSARTDEPRDAVKVASMKAAGTLAKSWPPRRVLSLPRRLDAVAGAGATAVVQPVVSVRDAEVIAAADEKGIAMVFTVRRLSGTDAEV